MLYLEQKMRMAAKVMFVKSQHPKHSILPEETQVNQYMRDGWIAQPKINGRNLQVHISASGEILEYTRHGTKHTKPLPEETKRYLRQFYTPSKAWNVLEGEYIYQTGKVYLFDFIVLEGEKLDDLTYLQRYDLLQKNFITPTLTVLPLLRTIDAAMELLKGSEDLIEGIVLKAPFKGFDDLRIVRCRKNRKL